MFRQPSISFQLSDNLIKLINVLYALTSINYKLFYSVYTRYGITLELISKKAFKIIHNINIRNTRYVTNKLHA